MFIDQYRLQALTMLSLSCTIHRNLTALQAHPRKMANIYACVQGHMPSIYPI